MEYDMCCTDRGSMRNFLTNDEKIELLKEYKKSLDKESQGVTERIRELEKNN